MSAEQHADKEPADLVARRLHRRNAGYITSLRLHTAYTCVRHLPHHPAVVWPALAPPVSRLFVRLVPRHGLQLNDRERSDTQNSVINIINT
jgi:hypothetical protein